MPQRDQELKFWQNYFTEVGDPQKYIEKRAGEYEFKTGRFPGFKEQAGIGLDLGCGLVSALVNSGKMFVACDPLMDEYNKLVKVPQHVQEDGENLSFLDNHFDWILCNNVIDHTPDPGKMAAEMLRVLKPGGKVYFEVNFDDHLSETHYGIWDLSMVADCFTAFKLDWCLVERNPNYPQYWCYAVFKKPL